MIHITKSVQRWQKEFLVRCSPLYRSGTALAFFASVFFTSQPALRYQRCYSSNLFCYTISRNLRSVLFLFHSLSYFSICDHWSICFSKLISGMLLCSDSLRLYSLRHFNWPQGSFTSKYARSLLTWWLTHCVILSVSISLYRLFHWNKRDHPTSIFWNNEIIPSVCSGVILLVSELRSAHSVWSCSVFRGGFSATQTAEEKLPSDIIFIGYIL